MKTYSFHFPTQATFTHADAYNWSWDKEKGEFWINGLDWSVIFFEHPYKIEIKTSQYKVDRDLAQKIAADHGFAQNRRIAMIKEYRDRMGCTLKEAKQMIDEICPPEYPV